MSRVKRQTLVRQERIRDTFRQADQGALTILAPIMPMPSSQFCNSVDHTLSAGSVMPSPMPCGPLAKMCSSAGTLAATSASYIFVEFVEGTNSSVVVVQMNVGGVAARTLAAGLICTSNSLGVFGPTKAQFFQSPTERVMTGNPSTAKSGRLLTRSTGSEALGSPESNWVSAMAVRWPPAEKPIMPIRSGLTP